MHDPAGVMKAVAANGRVGGGKEKRKIV